MLSTQKCNTPKWNAYFRVATLLACRSQWPRCLRRWSAAASRLRSWVRIAPVSWTSLSWDCCVLSGTGLCDELITRPEEFYWLWRVIVCDLKTSWMRRPWPTGGLWHQKKDITCIHWCAMCTRYLLFVLCIYCLYYVSIVCTMYLLFVLCIYCLYCVSIVCTMYLLSLIDAGQLFT
jgi:hypothetical protein